MYIDENVIVAICFIIFIFLCFKPVALSIKNTIDNRVNKIKSYYEKSLELQTKAQEILQQAKIEQDSFEKKKSDLIKEATNNTKQIIDQRMQELNKVLDYKKRDLAIQIKTVQHNLDQETYNKFSDRVIKIVNEYMRNSKNNSTLPQ
ncbi:MAG TPA: hypothetical protein QKA14_01385, partial [Candidatus Megaira endosymbiont of Hartmannula sinica]|nr:hypothetical protein [Candidatus Megaera endosymbiont of Hartmannula sinica]